MHEASEKPIMKTTHAPILKLPHDFLCSCQFVELALTLTRDHSPTDAPASSSILHRAALSSQHILALTQQHLPLFLSLS